MATEGPNIPGTGANDAALGDEPWTNPTNIQNDGTSNADAVNSGSDETTQWLKATNYGFSIPAGATIDGVEVELNGLVVDASSIDTNVLSLQLVKGGTISSTDKQDGYVLTTSPVDRTYGGTADLWGLTLTDTDVNASNFGVALRLNTNRNDTASIDTIKITITYTAAAAGGENAYPFVTQSIFESPVIMGT